jgi:hypothetical protein
MAAYVHAKAAASMCKGPLAIWLLSPNIGLIYIFLVPLRVIPFITMCLYRTLPKIF